MSDLFDDLRSDGGGNMQFDEEERGKASAGKYSDFDKYDDLDDDPRPRDEQGRPRRKKGKGLLGMTAGQRFVLVFLLFILSLIFSSACLLVTGRIVI
jgi:hypothetical protein